VIPAARASSVAVSARPSIMAWSIAARAGSPTKDATSAIEDVVTIAVSPNLRRPFSTRCPRMLRP